ncbi:GGDEF domain-containing protein [Geodermatophilus ruber]|uniref:Diguanylate cyclase (GGDEF) domain-containing protein n=1 Tax=Geodermatophilus ruber TaxID=504800 RepID=A0A1I4DFJ9_9ACTN|nr:GGDEF domain-containing protein [Geodermatophilus ruber]SFK91639.1 diguanylate cyclase (GGDEF) domain-containing protein [Geodermatophilus ruber]
MRFIRLLKPRHETVAARAFTLQWLVIAALLAVYLVVEPVAPGRRLAAWGLVVALVGLALVTCVVPARWLTRLGMWPVLPVAGMLAVVGIALLIAPDHSEMLRPLLVFPVLFAATKLRAPVAAGITMLALVADAVILGRGAAPTEAFIRGLFFAPVLIVMTVLLAQGMNWRDRLLGAVRQQAAVDSLTGLVTRRRFDEVAEQALAVAPRPEGTALILLDVDAFKSVNDTYGHPVGDDALLHLAAVLSEQVRAGDAVISRLGGDELAVLLPGCSVETAARRAEQLVDAVRATPLLLADGTLLALSVSAGVAHAPRHATELRSLYAAADAALYRAKQAGRNRAAVADAPA